MTIDWAALGVVAVVSVVASVVFVILLSYGIRFVSMAKVATSAGRSAVAGLTLGYVFLGVAMVLVLFCLWLIVPQFH